MKDKYFKSILINLEKNLDIPIVCKIYCFNNIFIAEEIVTGATFPIIHSNYLYTSDDKIIPIRENFLEGMTLVLPKCIKQELRRNYNKKNIYDIRNHFYEKNKYKNFLELTKELDNFNLDYIDEELNISLDDSLFDAKKYISEMKKDDSYTNSIWQAKIDNNKIFETLGYYISKINAENLYNTSISTNISTNNNSSENNYKFNTPNLNLSEISKYGYDLASKEEFVELIEREEEIKKIIKSVCIKNSSILLIGESGCGKTAIVEEIARLTRTNNIFLNGKTIFSLNTNCLLAGSKYRGSFEQNIQTVINFCRKNKKQIILFIDEIHTLKGLGASIDDSNDAINILKPYISDGTIIVIGATTKNEYKKYLTEDEAFLRRFEKINLEVLGKEKIVDILINFNKKLEEKYNIKFNINQDTLKEIFNLIVELTDRKHQRIIGDIAITNPTLSKYLLEDAYAESIYEGKDEVTIDELIKAIRSCDKVSPTKKEELADLILEQYKEIEFIDEEKQKKDNVIKLSFN